MIRNLFIVTLALCALPTPRVSAEPPASRQTLVESVFQGGTDGWKGVVDGALTAEVAKLRGQAAPVKPARETEKAVKPSRDPNSPTGGMITLAALGGDGRTLYFEAPNKYKGNRTAAYGGSLIVQIRQAATTKLYQPPFVVLSSKQTILFYYLGRVPGSHWEKITVPLKEGPGWVNPAKGERAPATKADFDAVLAAVAELWIEAEFSTGEDRAELAEVRIDKPTP